MAALRTTALCLSVFFLIGSAGCRDNSEPRYTYHEFDMIFAFYKTDSLKTYQALLPKQFSMPKDPMVRVFVADYYKMDARTTPYQEAAVHLLVEYEGKPAWYCVTMPVTSHVARLGGLYLLGFPKIMGDVAIKRRGNRFEGVLKLDKKKVMSLSLDTGDYQVSAKDEELFSWMKDIPNLNIKRGKVFDPKFGKSTGEYSLLELWKMFPDKLEVKMGKPEIVLDASAAADHKERLGEIFSIRPTEMIMGYYFKNKFVARFNQ